VREIFSRYFPDPLRKRSRKGGEQEGAPSKASDGEYATVVAWFEAGNRVELSDDMPAAEYRKVLESVKGLKELVERLKPGLDPALDRPAMMEFILDGLHQNSRIARDETDHVISYKDMVGSIFYVDKHMRDDE